MLKKNDLNLNSDLDGNLLNELNKYEVIKQEILKKRKNLPEKEYISLSEALYVRVIQSKLFLQAKHILMFYSKRSAGEVDTVRIINIALNQSKRVSLPKTDLINRELQTFEIKNTDTDIEPGSYGIMEPISKRCKETTFSEDVDLVFVPGTLFDKFGARWGYGAGYYDRFLQKYKEKMNAKRKKMPPIIGIAFDFQIIENHLPQKATDVRLNGVITDKNEYYDRS